MKSIQNHLRSLYESLNAISEDLYIYHYERAEDYTIPYGVWVEEGENESFHTDNGKEEQVIEGSLSFYTETEFDPLIDAIQGVLNDTCSGWNLDSVQYEDETKLIHYSWSWQAV